MPALSTAPAKSKRCTARDVFGNARAPIAKATIPIGTLTANSHGHGATDRIPLAMVGPAAAEMATTTALRPMPRPSMRWG